MNLKGLDLNLLVALDVLLRERSITRGGERLGLSQSAMSGALARLREYFSDPLLVPVGRSLMLTPLAEGLSDPVTRILRDIQAAISTRAEFDPAHSDRRFSIMASDYAFTAFMPQLFARLEREAPSVTLQLRQLSPDWHEELNRGDIDFLIVPERYAALYDPKAMPLWPNAADDLADKPSPHRLYRDEITHSGTLTDDEWRTCIARYYAFCTLIDEQLGRMLALLEELGVAEDTLLLFVSDHGDLIGAHRLWDKGPMLYEEQLHIPCVARLPGRIPSGTQCDAFVSLLDLMPTLAEGLGLSLPQPVDGRSIWPQLCGAPQPPDWPDDAYVQYHGEGISLYSIRALRTERHKYVYYPFDRDELYDLHNDPWEMRNLINDPASQLTLADMRQRLLRRMEQADDVLREWNADLKPLRTRG